MINLIKDFCNKYNITENQYYGKEVINNYLEIIEDELPKNFSPIISSYLIIRNLKYLPLNFNPIILGNIYLNDLEELPENFNIKIMNSLNLYNINKLPEKYNITSYGSLFINKIKELPKNIHQNVNVSGYIYYNGRQGILSGEKCLNNPPPLLEWYNGDLYVIADNMNNYAWGNIKEKVIEELNIKINNRIKGKI